MKYNEFFRQLKESELSLLKNYPTVGIYEISTKDNLSIGKKNLNDILISDNEIWLECRCLDKDTEVNTNFTILLPHHHIENYIDVNAKLIYIYERIGQIKSLDIFSKGYSATCLIRFEGGIPNELKNVRKVGEKFDINENEIYYLLQEEAYKYMEIKC